MSSMLPISSALAIIDQIAAKPRLEHETIHTRDALGRVLASTQHSRLNLPPFNKSAMDGYAIIANDIEQKVSEYKLLEVVAAGEIAQQKLLPGTTIKVMTGAPVPTNTAVVVPIELTEEINSKVRILTWPKTSNICLEGEDVKCNDLVLSAGASITPVAIANLIACGIMQVNVYRHPRVAIISTGDEIVDDFSALTPSKIMDSNGPMLCALCQKHGLDIVDNCHVVDDYQQTVQTLKNALIKADIVLLSGGVSVGDFDFVAKAMSEVGLTTHFDSVAIKPGKPITCASGTVHQKNKLVFGLPGNPVSTYITFFLFVLRALRVIFGVESTEKFIQLPLAQNFKRSKADRVEYVPCCISADGTLLPLKFHGSAHLAALLQCDGFLVIPEGVLQIAVGEKASVFLYC